MFTDLGKYKEFIIAIGDFDPTTRQLFEAVLPDEEEHLWTFNQMLDK